VNPELLITRLVDLEVKLNFTDRLEVAKGYTVLVGLLKPPEMGKGGGSPSRRPFLDAVDGGFIKSAVLIGEPMTLLRFPLVAVVLLVRLARLRINNRKVDVENKLAVFLEAACRRRRPRYLPSGRP
jgi:hypothetical protein